MQRVLAMMLLGMILRSVAVESAELLLLDQPGLAIPWNAQLSQLAVAFPGIESRNERNASYRGQLKIGPISYQDRFVSFGMDPIGGLDRIVCSIDAADTIRLIQALENDLGPARWANYGEARMFQHFYEWSNATYTIELTYASRAADRLAAPYELVTASLTMQRDKPALSRVDAALNLPQQMAAMRKQMQEAQLTQQQARDERTAARAAEAAAPINAASRQPLRRAQTTWGAVFQPASEAPVNSFNAYYFNTNAPRTALKQEIVADVAVSYVSDEFLKIKSEDFGAYWVGRIKVKQPEVRVISVSQSWAKTRVIIDGAIAFEGGNDARIPFEFSAGEHRIEVEYVNNWHTTDFKLTIARPADLLTKEQIRAELQQKKRTGLDVLYASLYESRNRDLTVVVNAESLRQDTVLVLSSYSSIKWIVTGNSKHIKAVVFGSVKPGSEVVGLSARAVVLQQQGWIGDFRTEPSCHCVAGHYHCEHSSSLAGLRTAIEDLTGGKLVGYNSEYGATTVTLPGHAFTAEVLESDRLRSEANEARRRQCVQKSDPDFEHMMQ